MPDEKETLQRVLSTERRLSRSLQRSLHGADAQLWNRSDTPRGPARSWRRRKAGLPRSPAPTPVCSSVWEPQTLSPCPVARPKDTHSSAPPFPGGHGARPEAASSQSQERPRGRIRERGARTLPRPRQRRTHQKGKSGPRHTLCQVPSRSP